MVTDDDNCLMGLTYEAALLKVCDGDIERYNKIMMEINPLLAKIPEGWTDE